MNEEFFIDSSIFFVWADKDSRRGEDVESIFIENKQRFITTDIVIAETISLLTKRIGKHKGLEVGGMIMSSSVIFRATIDDDVFKEAWQLYKKYKDKDFDLIDATSFVICHKRKIKKILTLDKHFSQMGFQIFPG